MNVIELHEGIWNRLQGWRSRLPHALLLTGQRGIGKFALAQAFAQALLCEQPTEAGGACGHCLACGWYAQGNHPDFRLLQPEALAEAEADAEEGKKKASQQITIDQVRVLDEFFTVGTHRGGLRIILVAPVEAMNRNTANALLKTLEEPAAGTLFLLVSDEPMRLLPTIRSRCQVLPVPLPAAKVAVAALQAERVQTPESWLALAGGAPLLARDLATSGQGAWLEGIMACLSAGGGTDALAAAATLDKLLKDSKGKLLLRHVVEWVQKWVVDLLWVSHALPARYFRTQQATMQQLAGLASPVSMLRFSRQLIRWRRDVEQPLNSRLFLETLMLDYRAVFAAQGAAPGR